MRDRGARRPGPGPGRTPVPAPRHAGRRGRRVDRPPPTRRRPPRPPCRRPSPPPSSWCTGTPPSGCPAVGVMISCGVRTVGYHAFGFAAAISVMGASRAPSAWRCSSGELADRRPPSHVAKREREPGLEHLMGHLGGMERRLERERRCLRSAVRPRRSLPRLLQPALGVECLRSHDDGDVGRPADDPFGGRLEQLLGHRPTDARVLGPASATSPPRRRAVRRGRRTATTCST